MQKILSWFIYAAGGAVFLVGCYYIYYVVMTLQKRARGGHFNVQI